MGHSIRMCDKDSWRILINLAKVIGSDTEAMKKDISGDPIMRALP